MLNSDDAKTLVTIFNRPCMAINTKYSNQKWRRGSAIAVVSMILIILSVLVAAETIVSYFKKRIAFAKDA